MDFRIDFVGQGMNRTVAKYRLPDVGVGGGEVVIGVEAGGVLQRREIIAGGSAPAVHVQVVAAVEVFVVADVLGVGVVQRVDVFLADQVGLAGAIGHLRHAD